jgi:hypothetical protein
MARSNILGMLEWHELGNPRGEMNFELRVSSSDVHVAETDDASEARRRFNVAVGSVHELDQCN